ncbi:MAG: GumC family protein [Gammaproteobacteria bacterium]
MQQQNVQTIRAVQPDNTSPVGGMNRAAIEPTDPGLAEMLVAVSRRKRILLGTVIGALILAALYLIFATPRYTADALILIEPQNTNFVSVESVVTGISGDAETVQSQSLVLSSRELAGRVIQRLELYADPEFNPNLDDQADGAPSLMSREMSAIVDQFLKRLAVLPQDNSRVIAVSFSSEVPEKAAEIANALADEYIVSGLEAKFESTRRANDWLGVRIEELRAKVQEAEQQVEEARAGFGLLEGNGATLASQELAQLNTELVIARNERTEAAARLGQVRRLQRDQADIDSVADVLNSVLIQRLREQEAEVERRVADYSQEYGERHPKMIQLRAEADDLESRIQAEINKIVAGLSNQVAVARARENALEARLDELKKTVVTANQNEIGLRALDREAEANRSLLATMLARQKETLSQEDVGFQQSDARVISTADIPLEPSFPRPAIVLSLVLIGATILGLIAILILELLDDGFRSGDEVERATGIPSIGFIPLVPDTGSHDNLLSYIAGKPATAFGESIRTLNWSLSIAFPSPPKSVLITSSVPGEGKTTIAACLATSQSVAGRKVILIDADTRQPVCHELVGFKREPGLTDYLIGEATLDEILVERDWSGLTLLPAGMPNPNAPNLFESQKMRDLIAELEDRFDLVVIDSPPVMAAADARILCRMTDATVAIVRWEETRRTIACNTLAQLQSADAKLAGVLISMVDTRKHAKYGYGDSGAYTGDLEKYYAG